MVQERLTSLLQTGLSAPVQARLGHQEVGTSEVHWIEVKRSSQIADGLRVALILELDSSQLQRKAFVLRLQPGSGRKGFLRLGPSSQLS